jgi:hypothetical protein
VININRSFIRNKQIIFADDKINWGRDNVDNQPKNLTKAFLLCTREEN